MEQIVYLKGTGSLWILWISSTSFCYQAQMNRQLYSKICSDREDTLLLPATTLDTLTSTWFVSYFLSLL